MVRRLMAALALAALATPALADRIGEKIAAQLRAQGFTQIEISRTLLGRGRIVAKSPTASREIVFNPRTGLIMRDYSSPVSDDVEPGFSLMGLFGRERASAVEAASMGRQGDDDSGDGDPGKGHDGDSDGHGGHSDGDDGGDTGSGDSGSGDSGSGDSGGDDGGDDGGSGDGHGGGPGDGHGGDSDGDGDGAGGGGGGEGHGGGDD